MQATVREVAKSWARLSDFTFLSSNHQRNDLFWGSDFRKLNRRRCEYWALLLRGRGGSTAWAEMQPACL